MKPLLVAIPVSLLLGACANPALKEAEDLGRTQQWPAALRVLDEARAKDPADATLRAAQIRTREQAAARFILQIESLRAVGRWDDAQAVLAELAAAAPQHPRLSTLSADIERGRRHEAQLSQGRVALKEGRLERAESIARDILAESPQHPGARRLASQVAQTRPVEGAINELGPAFQKPVTLEFRDAPLRQVFEALARSSGINFVFDKEVRSDSRVTIFLRNVTLDEAMRVMLNTQQLDRKLLNDSTVLIYPGTANKQREYQDLITRTLYLTNADVKQAQAMLRTIAKVRDIHIDERLNLLILRDTPEVVRLAEKLIASMDLPEPEVMLEVEVMELASDQLDALGLQWPDTVQLGISDASGAIPDRVFIGGHNPTNFRASIANPAIVATLHGTSGNVNLLANPKIRVRNHDKAKVHIGQKLPVFTTTTNFTGATSVAASVSYLDVGLKLDVEPSIQLDSDVIIKVGLEVSNTIRQAVGPGGTTAYEIGTRTTATSLRLADGETQVLAGLINDEDRKSAAGIPGLSRIPLLGRLFGTTTDTRSKSEVVLLITPHIVRNLPLPDLALTRLASGTDTNPGALSSQIRREARISGDMGSGLSAMPPSAAPEMPPPMPAPIQAPVPAPDAPMMPGAPFMPGAPAGPDNPAAAALAPIRLDVTPQVPAGGTVTVALNNANPLPVKGELSYDPTQLALVQPVPGATPGRVAVAIGPGSEQVLVFRALPSAAGKATNLTVANLSATAPGGAPVSAPVQGSGLIQVGPAR